MKSEVEDPAEVEEDSADGEEPQESTSVMYRNIGNRKHGNPTSSTSVYITRDLASRAPKRRQLVSADVLHSSSVSPISRSCVICSVYKAIIPHCDILLKQADHVVNSYCISTQSFWP